MSRIILLIILYAIIIANGTPATVATYKAIIHSSANHEEGDFNYLITKEGEIQLTRSIRVIGEHTEDRNQFIGIALEGEVYFNEVQHAMLIKLLWDLNTLEIELHNDNCPGPGLDISFIEKAIELQKEEQND